MAKEKLSFKDGSRFCYSVKENNLKDFYDKIVEFSMKNEDGFLIELRLDYLINKKIDVKDILDCITRAKKYLADKCDVKRQYIATIRSFANGGNCIISDKDYLSFVEALNECKAVAAIDIDYSFYESKSANIKKLFAGGLFSTKKTFIITYSCRDKILTKDEYAEVFKTLIKTPADIIKIVTKAFSTVDAENLMTTARDYDKEIKKAGKLAVVISTGKLGILSRVWYEYTNTIIIYLDAYEPDMVPLGEIDKKVFDKCRKLISKLDEFSALNASVQEEI